MGGFQVIEQGGGTRELATQAVADAYGQGGRGILAFLYDVEMGVEGGYLENLRHVPARDTGQCSDMSRRDVPELVVDQVQVFEQHIAAVGACAEQVANVADRAGRWLPAFPPRPSPLSALSWVPVDAGIGCFWHQRGDSWFKGWRTARARYFRVRGWKSGGPGSATGSRFMTRPSMRSLPAFSKFTVIRSPITDCTCPNPHSGLSGCRTNEPGANRVISCFAQISLGNCLARWRNQIYFCRPAPNPRGTYTIEWLEGGMCSRGALTNY